MLLVFFLAAMALAIVIVLVDGPYEHPGIVAIENKHQSELYSALTTMCHNPEWVALAATDEFKEKRGKEMIEAAFRKGLIDHSLLRNLICVRSGDFSVDPERIDDEWPEDSCSRTAPIAGELVDLLKRKGSKRTVIMTLNSRNWTCLEGLGVDLGIPVLWSDGTAEFMTQEQAEEEWGITEEEWNDPAGRLFGKKAPFAHTYE